MAPNNNPITLKRTNSKDPDFHHLVQQLDKELWKEYGEEMNFFGQFNIIEDSDTIVLAYDDGTAVGCGCFKAYEPGTAELKRMFVNPEYRGKRIGSAILAELEIWAKNLNFKNLILETGELLNNAIRMYQKHNYTVTENFAPYIGVESKRLYEESPQFSLFSPFK